MIVQCEQCDTKFQIADDKVGPDGAWMRCSKCQHVFHVEPPQPEPEPEAAPPAGTKVDLAGGPDEDQAAADELDLGLDEDLAAARKAKGGGVFRAVFWLLAVLLVVILVGLGGLVAMDRLGMNPELVQRTRKIPGVGDLLNQVGVGAPLEGEDRSSQIRDINLVDHRVYIRSNAKAGRLLVIQGKVTSQRADKRSAVKVRGRLLDRDGSVVSEDTVFAGTAFDANELRELDPAEMKVRLSQAQGSKTGRYVLEPKGYLPFMILFVNPPGNVTEFTAEVVGSEKYQP